MTCFDYIRRCAIGCLITCLAQRLIASEPKIEAISPSAIRVGTTSDFRITGEGLTGLLDVVFYHPYLECTGFDIESDYEAVVTLHAVEPLQVETVPFRMLTRSGFSNLKTMRLVDVPLMIETPRENRDSVIEIPDKTGMAIYGTLGRGEYDRYKIVLKAGERLTAVVEAMRLGGVMLDTALKVYGPDGQIAADVDDTSLYKQDPYLSFVAEQSGLHTIEVHETNYDGSEDSHYVLFTGTGPSLAILYPPGGQEGEVLEAVGFAESRVRSEIFRTKVGPLKPSPNGWVSHRISDHHGSAVSSVKFRVSPFPNVMEQEGNDTKELATKNVCSIPVALCGIIQTPGDIDYFAFDVQSGQELLFDVFADRLGSPIDSLLSIYDSDGKLVIRGDDWISQDSRVHHRFEKSGVYFLAIQDKLSDGWPYGVYRIEISELRPRVTSFLPRPSRTSQSGQSVAVPRGNRTVVNLGVSREHVEGDATIAFANLPEGLHISSAKIPDGRFWIPTIASASDTAPIGGNLTNVISSIDAQGNRIEGGFSQVVDMVAGAADSLFHGIELNQLAVAVVEPVPFHVDLEIPPSGLPVGGSVGLRVTVKRDEGFDEPITIRFPHMPPWSTCEPEATIPKGETAITHVIRMTRRGSKSQWPFVVTGEVDVKNADANSALLRGRAVSSELVDLSIIPSPLTGEFPQIAGEQGEVIKVVCQLSKTGDIPEILTATLEGLPNRVICAPVSFSGSDDEFQMTIQLQPDAPLGTFASIQCRLSGQIDGYPTSYVIADQILMQIEAPGKLLRGASGQILSPLEALKKHGSAK